MYASELTLKNAKWLVNATLKNALMQQKHSQIRPTLLARPQIIFESYLSYIPYYTEVIYAKLIEFLFNFSRNKKI